MQVKDIMNKNPTCCLPDETLPDVAKRMVDFDCGSIPVVSDLKTKKPLVGIITDRDIVCRTLAVGKNPMEMKVKDVMSSPVASVQPDDDIAVVVDIMETYQVRRIPAVDKNGAVRGLVTQAHLAKNLSDEKVGEVVKNVSQTSDSASAIPTHVR